MGGGQTKLIYGYGTDYDQLQNNRKLFEKKSPGLFKDNWYRSLDIKEHCSFKLDDRNWASIYHYYLACHFFKDNKLIYNNFSLPKTPEESTELRSNVSRNIKVAQEYMNTLKDKMDLDFHLPYEYYKFKVEGNTDSSLSYYKENLKIILNSDIFMRLGMYARLTSDDEFRSLVNHTQNFPLLHVGNPRESKNLMFIRDLVNKGEKYYVEFPLVEREVFSYTKYIDGLSDISLHSNKEQLIYVLGGDMTKNIHCSKDYLFLYQYIKMVANLHRHRRIDLFLGPQMRPITYNGTVINKKYSIPISAYKEFASFNTPECSRDASKLSESFLKCFPYNLNVWSKNPYDNDIPKPIKELIRLLEMKILPNASGKLVHSEAVDFLSTLHRDIMVKTADMALGSAGLKKIKHLFFTGEINKNAELIKDSDTKADIVNFYAKKILTVINEMDAKITDPMNTLLKIFSYVMDYWLILDMFIPRTFINSGVYNQYFSSSGKNIIIYTGYAQTETFREFFNELGYELLFKERKETKCMEKDRFGGISFNFGKLQERYPSLKNEFHDRKSVQDFLKEKMGKPTKKQGVSKSEKTCDLNLKNDCSFTKKKDLIKCLRSLGKKTEGKLKKELCRMLKDEVE